MANRTWVCLACGWLYDESEGLPDQGIPPGTPFEDLPDDFLCPECGADKSAFDALDG